MTKKNLNFVSFKNVLFILCLLFPLIVVFRSLAINLNVIFISILILFFFTNKENLNFLKNNYFFYLIIFFSYIFFNSLINFQNFETLLKSFGNFRYLFLSIGVYLFLKNISLENKRTFIFFNFFLVSLICLDIIYQFVFGQNLLGFKPGMCSSELSDCTRYSGFFHEELIAGAFISQIGLLIFFLLDNSIFKNKLILNVIKLLFFIFLLSTVIITGERNALLIFLISIFFIFFFYKKNIISFILILFTFLFIYLFSLNFKSINDRYINLLSSWNSSTDISIQNKIILSPWSLHYQAAFELFLQKPLFGHGPKSFRIKCKDTRIEKKTIQNKNYYKAYRACSTHPHNYMMEFLSEYGIVGCMFFLAFFLKIFLSLYRLKKKTLSKELYILFGVGSLLLAIMFPFKPSGSFLSTFNASIFFYLFGFFVYFKEKLK